ncbi:MAG: PAS domain S-box protein [Ignavibacteriales bacterium]|nr:PAS domain S-box protein [Ignavibacteriales bacterium]
MKHPSLTEDNMFGLNHEAEPKVNERTEYLQTERRLRLHIAVTRALAESGSLADALHKVLKALCIVGGWDYGEMWNLDATKVHLYFDGFWHDPRIHAQTLLDVSRRTTIGYGSDIPGKVWVGGKPMWLKELAIGQENPRNVQLKELGFHTAVAFPIRDLISLLGVIVLFRQEHRDLDKNLIEMFLSLGTQIGDFVKRKRAEEALQQSEQRFRALIEQSSDAITLLSAKGNIVYMSPSAERMFGYLPGEFLGRNAFEFVHPDDREYSMKLNANVMRTHGSSVTHEYRFRHKSREWLWMEGVSTNLLNDPAIRAIVTNTRDITERKRIEQELHESEVRFRLVVESAPNAMVVVDREGTILLVNKKLEELSCRIHGKAGNKGYGSREGLVCSTKRWN